MGTVHLEASVVSHSKGTRSVVSLAFPNSPQVSNSFTHSTTFYCCSSQFYNLSANRERVYSRRAHAFILCRKRLTSYASSRTFTRYHTGFPSAQHSLTSRHLDPANILPTPSNCRLNPTCNGVGSIIACPTTETSSIHLRYVEIL